MLNLPVTDEFMVFDIGRKHTTASSGAASAWPSELRRFHRSREFGTTILAVVLVGRVIVVALRAVHDLRPRWSRRKSGR